MLDLFPDESPWQEPLGPGAMIVRRLALHDAPALMAAIREIVAGSPFRQMVTPGGYTMSVAMSNCGEWGWTTDLHGYRYVASDPLTDMPWPPMPALFLALAQRAAQSAGYPHFQPDACLINRYAPGAKMSLHQDKDEKDLQAPIVSVSLGLPAIFQFGGARRKDPLKRVVLEHGDIVVWGGESRLFYHGVLPLKPGSHPLTDAFRYNLTFRCTGNNNKNKNYS